MAAHSHAHSHAGGEDNERRVYWSLLLTGGFMFAEAVGGWLSGSLALLADAGHMLTDFAALLLTWLGFRLSRRPADAERSYGYYRFEVLAAFVNGMALLALVGWIGYTALQRLWTPIAILAGPMLAIAVLGLLVNLLTLRLLLRGDHANLNIRGAVAHVWGDFFGSLAAIVAAVTVLTTGWTPIDPLLSLVVCLLILRSAWRIVSDSAHILLEGAPDDLDADQLSAELRVAIAGVQDVHHIHVWTLSSRHRVLTLHLTVGAASDHDTVLRQVKSFLASHWGVHHSTIQIERAGCPDHGGPGPFC